MTYSPSQSTDGAVKFAMSGVEETLNHPVDLKEDREFDVEPENQAGDGYFADPTRYLFYR